MFHDRRWRRRLLSRTALSGLPLAFGAVLLPGTVLALPQDGVVAAGAASIAQTSASSLAITQSTNAAIIDWQSFDIGAGESVEVFQPSAMATLLNRVVGGGAASNILGQLSATGRLTLINPSGITIGHNARIDVAGLIASTANIGNADFMAGNHAYSTPGMAGAQISNAGTITATDGGLVALVGPSVANSGAINARLGRVVLGGAETFTLDLYGDDLIHIGVDDAVMTAITADALVTNSGAITADGGVIQITARGGAAAIENVINMSGVVRARSVGMENGEVVFYGHDQGIVQVSGAVDTSGKASGQTGGNIKVLGDKVALTGNATLDTSGDAGGGAILVGGEFQGLGDTPTASRTFVGRHASIDASAITSGNAGTAIVWADGDTRYYGSITARGGALSGNGGMVEVSGKQNLGFDGTVDTSAPNGMGGSLLLDPDIINIVGAGGGADDGEFDDLIGIADILFADGGAATFTISEDTLEDLDLGGVKTLTLQANNKITIVSLTDGVLDLTGISTTITFSTGDGGTGFTMSAGHKILFDATDFIIDAVTGSIFIGALFGDSDVDLIANQITIDAASTFKSIRVQSAGGGIIINDNITTTGVRGLTLDGDTVIGGPSGGVTFAGGVMLASASGITLRADNLGAGDLVTLGALTLISTDEVDDEVSWTVKIDDTLHLGGVLTINAVNNVSGDEDGRFQVTAGQTLFNNGFLADISADNFSIDGSINAGTGVVKLIHSTGSPLTVGFDCGECSGMISADELSRITAGQLIISNPDDDILFLGVEAGQSDTIALFKLQAGDDVTFGDDPSTFVALTVEAVDDIEINASLTVTTGALTLTSGDDVRLFGVLHAAGPVTISAADEIEFADDIFVAGGMTLNAGTGDDSGGVIFSGITEIGGVLNINAAEDIEINANLTIATGDVIFNADTDSSGSGALRVADGATLTAVSGGIDLFAADVNLDGTSAINAASFFRFTQTAGAAINLGAGEGGDADGLLINDEIDDIFFSTTATGLVVINVTPTTVDDGEWDPEINLFVDDGSLDLDDFIANDDDGGDGHSSLLEETLAAGNYRLRIGNYPFEGDVAIEDTNPGFSASMTDYELSIEGAFVTGIEGGGGGSGTGFSASELQRITVGGGSTSFITSGDIAVDGVTGVAGLGDVSLTGHHIFFQGGASEFAGAVELFADDLVEIGAGLSSQSLLGVASNEGGLIDVLVNLGADAPFDFVHFTADTVSLHDVSTNGSQIYGNGVVIFNSTYRTGGGAFAVSGSVVALSPSTISTGGGPITIAGTISGAGASALVFDAGGGSVLVAGVDPTGLSDMVEDAAVDSSSAIDALVEDDVTVSEEDADEEDILEEEDEEGEDEEADSEDPYLEVVEEEDLGESADAEDDEGSSPGCACGA